MTDCFRHETSHCDNFGLQKRTTSFANILPYSVPKLQYIFVHANIIDTIVITKSTKRYISYRSFPSVHILIWCHEPPNILQSRLSTQYNLLMDYRHQTFFLMYFIELKEIVGLTLSPLVIQTILATVLPS